MIKHHVTVLMYPMDPTCKPGPGADTPVDNATACLSLYTESKGRPYSGLPAGPATPRRHLNDSRVLIGSVSEGLTTGPGGFCGESSGLAYALASSAGHECTLTCTEDRIQVLSHETG